MANPSVGRGINQDRKFRQTKLRAQPLVTRRFAAWAIEVSIIATSALLPLSMGNFAKQHLAGELVPLNPVVVTVEKVIANTLALPHDENSEVPQLTNLLWSAAIFTPIALGGWQLYILAKTGSTLPKRWFGLKVVTSAGKPPGIAKVLVREGVGTWGVPLTIAYILWRCTGLFPNPATLIALGGLMVLGEGMSARFNRQRRSFHDRLAGTYVVNANRVYAPNTGRLSTDGQPIQWDAANLYRWQKPAATAANAAIVPTPKVKMQRDLWLWMRQNPRFALALIASCSAAAVLGTLLGTQVYIRTQIDAGQIAAYNSEQLLSATRQLSADSGASLQERQQAILNLGTVNAPQAMQLLVNLLVQESGNAQLSNVIQQALVTSGPRALPYLQRLNQSLADNPSSTEQLQANQAAIAKIVEIYSGKLRSQDLSRTDLGYKGTALTNFGDSLQNPRAQTSGAIGFSLVLDQIDLSGIELIGANLNGASLQGTRWQSLGNDGIANTFDDAIANLTDAQMQGVNLTDADLSRVTLQGANLLHAVLNQANLAHANLTGANLSSTRMVEANLQQADLAEASLTGADLGAANLAKADLSAARLSRASALGTNLQLANLKASDWQGSDLSRADLSSANLDNANLNAARLVSANLRKAQMQNANLRNADFSQADLREANLTGADFQGAIFAQSNTTPADQFIESPAEEKSAVVEGVDFTNVKNLDTKQIAYICTQGGRHPRCP